MFLLRFVLNMPRPTCLDRFLDLSAPLLLASGLFFSGLFFKTKIALRYMLFNFTKNFIIIVMVFTSTTRVFAESDTEYLNHLIGKACQLKLSKQRYWNLLLHYEFSGDGIESTIDDPAFFISQNGKTDPEAELITTLSKFFTNTTEDNKHIRCRFVARFAWLKEQLQIDESRLPSVICSDFDQTIASKNFKSVALIFPVAYLNSPPSMFGHTFLRIKRNKDSTLLSTAVNYTAITDERMGFSYALKGISGGLKGFYYSIPYYEKIREYTAIESRDIWEYNLNLTEKETKRIMLHVWEMRDIYSDYFFFNENCSFGVLYLLEIARPSLRLINTMNPFWITPVSTVKAAVDIGIVEQISFRPSLVSSIRDISATLPKEARHTAYGIAKGTINLSDTTKDSVQDNLWPQTLDLASNYLQYLAIRRMLISEEYINRFQWVTHEIAKVHWLSDTISENQTNSRPDKRHSPGRIGIGFGCRSESCFSEINFRPVYHDVFDSHDKSFDDAHINLFNIIFRYNLKDHDINLHRFRILDIMSVPPGDLFITPLAWKMNFGVEKKMVSGGKERLLTTFASGVGYSMSIGPAIAYALADIELNLNNTLPNDVAFGTGGSAGFLVSLTSWWKIQGSIKGLIFVTGDNLRNIKSEVSQTFSISNNNSLSTIVSFEKNDTDERSEANIFFNHYF